MSLDFAPGVIVMAPPLSSTVLVLPVVGPAGPPGVPGGGGPLPEPVAGMLSAPVAVDGVLTVIVTSNWGLTSAGAAYYDPDGAVATDAAIASLDPSGALVLTRPGG